jgi:hypothetical protein
MRIDRFKKLTRARAGNKFSIGTTSTEAPSLSVAKMDLVNAPMSSSKWTNIVDKGLQSIYQYLGSLACRDAAKSRAFPLEEVRSIGPL